MTPDEERTAYLDNLEAEAERRRNEPPPVSGGWSDPSLAKLAEVMARYPDDESKSAPLSVFILAFSVLFGGSIIAAIIGLLLR